MHSITNMSPGPMAFRATWTRSVTHCLRGCFSRRREFSDTQNQTYERKGNRQLGTDPKEDNVIHSTELHDHNSSAGGWCGHK